MKIKLNIKNVLTLGITAIMITTFSLFFINTSLAANTAKVTVDTANLRETTQTDSKILDLINKGESVEVLETKGEWYKVKYKNITGYLRKDLVQLNNETTETVEENTTNKTEENTIEESTVSVNAEEVENTSNTENTEVATPGKYKAKEDLKLKVIPLINALEIDEIKKDTELEIKDIKNNWAYVNTQEKQGWVVLEKLEKVELKTESTQNEEPTNKDNQDTIRNLAKRTHKRVIGYEKKKKIDDMDQYITGNDSDRRNYCVSNFIYCVHIIYQYESISLE